jgi:GNAT superfamily N-acetyltransferase
MIQKVTTKRQLKTFVHYVEDLYKDDPYVVYPLFHILYKELVKEVLDTNLYTALLAYKDDQVVGRILYTVDASRKQGKDIGYFSYFDAINDVDVAKELFDHMEQDLSERGIDYVEGTFAPYDPDNRRGVLVKGFDSSPVIFTSYNYNYYGPLLEAIGCYKAIDTVLLDAKPNDDAKRRLRVASKYFTRSHNVRIDSLNLKDLDKDIADVHQVLEEATNDIIYQDAPSMGLIEAAATQLKPFIQARLIKIAREEETNRPVGFCLVLPDFNQLFKQTKGRIRPLKLLFGKKHINKARGMMQYVVPDYQNTGLIGHMFHSIYNEFMDLGITEFEAGTMMEDNPKAITSFEKFGGSIIKVYRLYGKDIAK